VTLTGLSGCAIPAENSLRAPNAHVSLAMAYLQQGHLEKARMALNQALAAQPHSPVAWSAMAYLEETSGNIGVAASDYQRAIRLDSHQGEWHNNYGVFLCRHGQPRAGIQEFLTAVQLPDYVYRATAYQNAARCALTIPDPTAAKVYEQTALRNRGRQN